MDDFGEFTTADHSVGSSTDNNLPNLISNISSKECVGELEKDTSKFHNKISENDEEFGDFDNAEFGEFSESSPDNEPFERNIVLEHNQIMTDQLAFDTVLKDIFPLPSFTPNICIEEIDALAANLSYSCSVDLELVLVSFTFVSCCFYIF